MSEGDVINVALSSSAITTIILFFIGQFVALLSAIIVGHMRTKLQLAEVKTQNMQMQLMIDSLKVDHKGMVEKVDGISRHVAIIEGMEKARSEERGLKSAGLESGNRG